MSTGALHVAELDAATRTSGSDWWTAGTAAAQRTVVLSGEPWAGQSWDLLSGTVCWDSVHGCWLVGVARLVTEKGYGGQHIFGSTFVRRVGDAGDALRAGDALLAECAATLTAEVTR